MKLLQDNVNWHMHTEHVGLWYVFVEFNLYTPACGDWEPYVILDVKGGLELRGN